MFRNFTSHLEKKIWSKLNANAITWIGNAAMFLAAAVAVYHGGLKYHDSAPVPGWVFILAGFCTQWFSIFDAMDGIRARRTKCGSPIGRIVDNAGDTMIYSFFALIAGYVVKVPPGWLTLGYALTNIPQFAMEMSFIISGNFKNCDEYFGPMEVELLISLVFWSAGIFGTDGLNKPTNLSFLPDSINCVHLVLGMFICIMAYFTLEAWVDCIKVDVKRTFKYGSIPLFTLGIAVLHASLSP